MRLIVARCSVEYSGRLSARLPEAVRLLMIETSQWCVVAAIAAVGMRTALGRLFTIGGPAVLLVVLETVFLGAIVLAAAALL